MTDDRAILGGPSQEITVPNEITIENIWTANCLVRPARPSTLRAVPDDPEKLDEEFDEELDDDIEDDLDLADSTDEDDEAELGWRG